MEPNQVTQSLRPADWLLVASIMISATVAILGWIVVHTMNRKLQRQQLAMTLCHSHRFQPLYQDAVRLILARVDPKDAEKVVNYTKSPKQALDGGKFKGVDQKTLDAIKLVLNYLEFMSIGVISESLNEAIVWHSMSGVFETMHQRLHFFIQRIRLATQDPTYYGNFTTLMTKWFPSDNAPIKPIGF